MYDELLYHGVEGISDAVCEECRQRSRSGLSQTGISGLSEFISYMCKESARPIVLIIDEVDQAGNYDIKNMKLKLRRDVEHQYNSPWNIAADFMVDMSFSISDIAGMLSEYEKAACTGMDILKMAELLYDYTSGYPFLVSRLCKILDEYILGGGEFQSLSDVWTKEGFLKAVNMLLAESNTLFDDMVKKLDDFPELKKILYSILFQGERVPYNVYNPVINLGIMFGFIKKSENDESIAVSNRIFETLLYNLFISEELIHSAMYRAASADRD